MTKNIKIIGCRLDRFKAGKLETNYIRKRNIKPFKTEVIKRGKKYCVKVRNKK